ncbi:hypothetical protein [Vibrio harveyi]|uniref:hypothetical protein n=1 Tax=Vibrio harveyi TaxID=669 RepID=UPI003CFA1DC4
MKILTFASNIAGYDVDNAPFEVCITITQGAIGELKRLRKIISMNQLECIEVAQSKNDTLKLMDIDWVSECIEGATTSNMVSCNTNDEIESFLDLLYKVQKIDFDDTLFNVHKDYFTLKVKPLGATDIAYNQTQRIYFKELDNFECEVLSILN